jgi:hypothetical protein
MKKLAPWILLIALICGLSGIQTVNAKPASAKMELLGKKKKYKGYKKPKSKKILGIFKRKTDCGCPNH